MRYTLKDRDARRALRTLTAIVALTSAAVSYAGPTPEQQCQAGQDKTAGKYAACWANAEAKLATSGDRDKYLETTATCFRKFFGAWGKLEEKALKADTACLSTDDVATVHSRITRTNRHIAKLVAGVRFEDNGDGTVTDHQTGLQWEQKDGPINFNMNFSNPHDVDNTYTWNTTFGGTTPNGTAFTDFLAKLNGSDDGTCFVGKCDWRLPTIEELQTILLTPPCGAPQCIPPVFGPTHGNFYWSATTSATDPRNAWQVYTTGGLVFDDNAVKGISTHVRAVRTGS